MYEVNYVLIKDRPLICSKCKSDNLAKPANKEIATWIYKCLDCGRTVEKKPPVISTGVCYSHGVDLDKPVEV